jgi:membrane associated rhomboid family serine protease
MMRLTPIVKHLILINVVVFFVLMIADMRLGDDLREYFYLYGTLFKSDVVFQRGNLTGLFRPAQIVTYFFAHRDVMHILFNMLALASLGPAVEMVLGPKRFLRFYLFCGVISGILLAFFDPASNPVLGASGAISGILAAFAYSYPNQGLSFFFLPPIPAKYLALGFAAISAVLILAEAFGSKIGGNISHFGHLAGMIAAVLYFYLEKSLPFLRK